MKLTKNHANIFGRKLVELNPLGKDPVGFSLDPLVQKNITLQGSFSHNYPIWEKVIALLASGTLDITPVPGHTAPLAEWHHAFETMHSGQVIKSVLIPS